MSNETNMEQPRSAISGIEAEADEAGMFSGTYRVVGMNVVRPVVERLEAERDALRNVCARSCEANAYDLEIRRLNAEIASLRNAISNEHRQGALDAQSEAILICARIEDEQEGASGETWARTIRTEIERMLIDNP